MGCICSKGVRTNDDYMETNHVSTAKDNLITSNKQSSSSRNIDNVDSEESVVNGNEATVRLIPSDTKNVFSDDEEEEKKESFERESTESVFQKETTMELVDNVGPLQLRMSRIGSVTNGERAAKVIAGWPSWLVSVAGEAINGWIPRCADSFEKLEMVRAFQSNWNLCFS